MRWLIVLLLLLPMRVRAEQEPTLNWLLDGCRGVAANRPGGDPKVDACLGSVRSVISVGQINSDICVPDGVDASQGVAIVIQYIDRTRHSADAQFGQMAYAALKASWPCGH